MEISRVRVFTAGSDDDAHHGGGGLRDIRQRNQRPDWRTAHALDHLHIV